MKELDFACSKSLILTMLLLYVYNQLKHVYGCALDDVENVREKSSESRVKWDYLSTSKGRRKSNRQS